MKKDASTPQSGRGHRPRLVIGLTGGIGSGKSTIGVAFERRGIALIDADGIAHAMTAPGGAGIEPIRRAFGPDFIAADGSMDRARMRTHVFRQPDARATLEAILHPLIRDETARQLAAATSPYVILMIPLLVEGARKDPRWRDRFDRILVVDCRETTQITRVKARNGFDDDAIGRIMAAQATREERLTHADDVIDNDGELDGVEPQVEALHQTYLDIARTRSD